MLNRRRLMRYGALLGLSPALLAGLEAQAQAGPRERQNIKQFSLDPAKVAALRAGVAKMKAISKIKPDDPAGWTYWASIHGITEAPPAALAAIYAQCDHTYFDPPGHIAGHFLSWHRAYLFFFESTLKAAARASGDQTAFELPYWNWYADGVLPAIFTEGSAATNPLWHKRQATALDPTSLHRDFFTQRKLLPPSLPAFQSSFSVPLEMNPHGSVHGVIGEDMGSIETSARDPIFWLHHANLDRLWTSWLRQGAGQANPAPTTAWGKSKFTFDTANAMTATASSVTNSEAKLGYRYDSYAIGPAAAPVAAPTPRPVRVIQGFPVVEAPVSAQIAGRPSTRRTVSRAPQITLRNDIVAVDLKLTPGVQKMLAAAAKAKSPGSSAWVTVENIQVSPAAKAGGFSYSVSASLPDKEAREVRLTEINTFALSTLRHHRGAHDHEANPSSGVTLSLPLQEVLKALGVSNSAGLAKGLRIVFRPVQLLEQTDVVDPVSVGSVTVTTSATPEP